jgi:hypothetical protein
MQESIILNVPLEDLYRGEKHIEQLAIDECRDNLDSRIHGEDIKYITCDSITPVDVDENLVILVCELTIELTE